MRLHPGCARALAAALETGIPTHVCSVGWSSTLIAATLSLHVPHRLTIHANEVEVDEHGAGTGGIVRYACFNCVSVCFNTS